VRSGTAAIHSTVSVWIGCTANRAAAAIETPGPGDAAQQQVEQHRVGAVNEDHVPVEGRGRESGALVDQHVDQELERAVVVAVDAEDRPDAGAEHLRDVAEIGK
jgi:hypothetical protein